jgi:DNA-binding CsgD family transcriptional regulator
MFVVNHRANLGIVEFREGDPRVAVEHFEAAEELRSAGELLLEPNMRFYYGDYVEALLELGRTDDADAIVEPWADEAERLDREWAIAHAIRCRGLVAAARGDVVDALSLLEDALARSQGAGPFAVARALLALGSVRRRARQKRAARQAFEEAIARFGSIGARSWAERAARELARVGGRTSVSSKLTASEIRVAALVAEGLTTKEVATRLFVSPRTVDRHLAHIYAKLGVRSRAGLTRRIARSAG